MRFHNTGNKTWDEITREERAFCLVLYNLINKKPGCFVENLLCKHLPINPAIKKELRGEEDWQVGFEVALYRDLIHYSKVNNSDEQFKSALTKMKDYYCEYKNKISKSYKSLLKGLMARKFDLALMGKKTFIIIEAKAAQEFSTEEVHMVNADKKCIVECEQEGNARVFAFALHSSEYTPQKAIELARQKIGFDDFIT